MKKALLTAAAVTAVGVTGLAGVNTAAAQTTGDSLVDSLATKFNLSSDEVQEVFDEAKQERRAEFEENRAEKLQEKVDEGVITQDQLVLLQDKVEELQAQKQELKEQDLSREEMREQMEAARADFQTWADENGIDLSAIRPERGERHGMGRGNAGGKEFRGQDSAAELNDTEATNVNAVL